jgi:hypothetical protein
MRQKVCAGLALAASYWRVPAAALGPGQDAAAAPGEPVPPAAVPQDRCERPTFLRYRPPRPGRHRAP